MVFSALMSNGGDAEARIWNRDWQFYVGVSFPCLAGLFISNVITSIFRLKKPERITVSIECCYQNVGIATSVALTMFQGPDLAEAMGVPLFYGAVEAIILGLYCLIMWKFGWTKAPSDAPLCHVLTTSYEVIRVEKLGLESIEVALVDDASTSVESMSENEDTLFHYFNLDQTYATPKETSGLVEAEEERLREESNVYTRA